MSISASTTFKTQTCAPTPENLARLGEALRKGELVAMPTETVYGLAGSLWNEETLASIFRAKERPTFDPLIAHVAESALLPTRGAASPLEALVSLGLVDATPLSARAREAIHRLATRFWPGPLTLILPKASRVPDLATSGLDTVGIRVPRHPVAQALLEAAGVPLAAPSANRFGRISPTTANAVEEELQGRIPWILDGGACEVGVESSIVHVSASGEARLLRAGGVARETLESALGYALVLQTQTAPHTSPQLSPGLLLSHYAPRKRLVLLPKPIAQLDWPDFLQSLSKSQANAPRSLSHLGLLTFSDEPEAELSQRVSRQTGCTVTVRRLSPAGDLSAAARVLFASLRALDASDAELLLAEPSPRNEGLGYAIQDRLVRASAPRI